ncbi:MAG: hypothetical protein HYZ74_08020 [Elusimicrobia bacterium]|nr:hypothetical protein [Elusimicrobiota bacterium]
MDRWFCRDEAALIKAVRGRDAALCGESGFCKAVMARSAKTCAALKEAGKDDICRADSAGKVKMMVLEEKKFRSRNALPPYRVGEPLLNTLPLEIRASLEKRKAGKR